MARAGEGTVMVGRTRICLTAVLLLAGCGSDPAPPERQVNAPTAPAPPVAAPPALAAPDEDQAAVIAAAQFAAGEPPLGLLDDDDGGSRYFDVVDCAEGDRVIEPAERSRSVRDQFERRVALLRRSLQIAGYRPDVFEAVLESYAAAGRAERRQGDPATVPGGGETPDHAALVRLAGTLEARRAELQPDMPPIRAEGGCGAAEVETVLRSEPAGARIWLITRFGFDVCRARRLDPWNDRACPRWSEVDPGRPAYLSGNYMYRARWQDGVQDRGSKRIEGESEDGEPLTVWIRHP